MLLDDDNTVLQRSRELADRYIELEKAVRFALSEIKEIRPEYLYDSVLICLSFNFKRSKSTRITPIVRINVGEQCDPNTVELDMNDIYQQIEEYFKLETGHGNKVDWDDLILDP